MNQRKLSAKIVNYLFDESFPAIVLLSGDWGSGKTHLVKKHLMPKLSELSKTRYMSLYGVESVEAFQDRVIASSFGRSQSGKKNIELLAWMQGTKDSIKNVAGLFGGGTVAAGVMAALARPIKQKLLEKVSDTVLIVDDLERVSNEGLISDILGECLNLVENNISFRVVVVANEKHIKRAEVLEKVFINRVVLSVGQDDLMDFIDSEYPDLLGHEAKIRVINLTHTLKLRNFRVFHRILLRYKPLKELIESNDVDVISSSLKLIEQITLICNAHFIHGYTKEELYNAIESPFFRLPDGSFNKMEKSQKTEEELIKEQREEKLDKLLIGNSSSISQRLIDYCLDLQEVPEDFIEKFELPLLSSPVDKLISYHYHTMSEEYFSELVLLTKKEIFLSSNPQQPQKWIRALNTLAYLSENGFINDKKETLIEMARKRIKEDENLFINGSEVLEFSLARNFECKEVAELYVIVKKIVEDKNRSIRINMMQEALVKSWVEVSDEIYRNFDFKPFIDGLYIVRFLNGIIKNWSLQDTILFSQYIEERYEAINSYKYLESEFSVIKDMNEELKKEFEKMPSSFKKGRVNELITSLRKAISCIERSEERKRLLEINALSESSIDNEDL